ncbi:MAG: AEC family transporter [Desulfobacterales bacterium]
MIILSSLFPVFAMIGMGRLLKHFNLTSDTFLKTSDRLVYFFFFPALLFWKIGGAQRSASIDWNFCIATICSVLFGYIFSLIFIFLFKVPAFKAGTFSQCCYRFSSYIGIAIVLSASGEEGVRHYGILIGFVIPVINVLAVSTLIWFSGESYDFRDRCRITIGAIISNPLIAACVAGVLYSRFIHNFPPFLDNSLRLVSSAAIPLSLLSIGGLLTFKAVKDDYKLSLAAAAIKLIIFPSTGYLFYRIFSVTGVPFGVGMIFFALPTSTAIYILSSQLGSDTKLASAAIMISTILSFFSLSAALILGVS